MRLAQLTRSHEWWDHKTPQVLSLAYATALMGNTTLYHLLSPAFLMIFASLIVIAIYASIINDLTDLEIDIACGKSNMMQRLYPATRWLLMLVSLGVVITTAFFIYPNILAIIFYLLIVISISLYSFPPIRLKSRRIWGVLSCASAEHLFPSLFSISVIAYYSNTKPDIRWLCAAGVLSFLYGVRSILWHQFLDRENDMKSGISTFGTSTNPDSFRNKSLFILSIELLALAVVLFQLKLVLPVLFLLLYILFIVLRRKYFHSQIILVAAPKNSYFQIAMLDYYTIFFPLSLLIYVAFIQPLGWMMLIIHVLLFHKTLVTTLKDGFFLGRSILFTLRN